MSEKFYIFRDNLKATSATSQGRAVRQVKAEGEI